MDGTSVTNLMGLMGVEKPSPIGIKRPREIPIEIEDVDSIEGDEGDKGDEAEGEEAEEAEGEDPGRLEG